MLSDTVRMGGKPVSLTSDRMELVALRLSIAMACQECNVQTPDLPVLGRSMADLTRMGKQHERGWKNLLAALTQKVKMVKEITISDFLTKVEISARRNSIVSTGTPANSQTKWRLS